MYVSDTDPASLDPQQASDTVSITVLGNVHRGLMYWDANLQPVLAGAESFENNEDFSQFTFRLRQDHVFSNGDPVTAADYVRSVRRLADPRNAFDYGYMSCFIAGTEELSTCGGDDANVDQSLENLGVTAVDDHTLQFDLVQPATFFLSVVAMWLYVPLHESMAAGDLFDEAEGYIGSGPYMMRDWAHDSQINLVPNPTYAIGTQPPAEQVLQLNIGGDPDAALALYEQGGLDMVGVPGPQVRRILDDPALSQEAVQLEAQSITYYNFALCGLPNELQPNRCPDNPATQNGEGPTQSLEFRKALTHAVDKQRMIDFLRGGLGTPAYTFVMPGIPGADEELNSNPPYGFDTAAAGTALQAALTELGVSDADGDGEVAGADLGALKLIYNTDAGHLPYIAFLAEAWRTGLGLLDLELVGVDFPTLLEIRGNGENDIARNGWGADFSHAHNQLNDLYRCGGGNNDGNYCNTAFDDLMDEAAQTVDLEAQTQLYMDAQDILVNDAASLPLFFPVATYLIKPWVQGEIVTASDHTNPGDQFFETIVISGRQ